MELKISVDPILQQAAQEIKAGNKAKARSLISSYLKGNSQSAPAWYLAAYVLDERNKQIDALQRALVIAPDYQPAKKMLAKLQHRDELDLLLSEPPSVVTSPKKNEKVRLMLAIVLLALISLAIGGLVLITRPNTALLSDYGVMAKPLPLSVNPIVLAPDHVGNLNLGKRTLGRQNSVSADYGSGGKAIILFSVTPYQDATTAKMEFSKEIATWTDTATRVPQPHTIVLINTANIYKQVMHLPNQDAVVLEWVNGNYTFSVLADTPDLMDEFMAAYPY